MPDASDGETHSEVTQRVLKALVGKLRDGIYLEDSLLGLVVLWILATHTFSVAKSRLGDRDYRPSYFPILSLESVFPGSGKTAIALYVSRLSANAVLTESGGMTRATLLQLIEQYDVIILDEVDQLVTDRRGTGPIMSLFNNRYERTEGLKYNAPTAKGTYELTDIDPYGPTAFSGLVTTAIPKGTKDRKLPLLVNRAPSEFRPVVFDSRTLNEFRKSELETWAQTPGLVEKLSRARPDLPDEWNHRQRNKAEYLVAIADIAGSPYSELARKAFGKLYSKASATVATREQLLLESIRELHSHKLIGDVFGSEVLVRALVAMPDSPWGLVQYGKRLSTQELADMLAQFEIVTQRVSENGTRARRYDIEQFKPLFALYLPFEETD